MKCLWGIALSCFCALVSLGLLQAENLSREPLASFPPFTEESLLPFDPETQEIVDDGLVLTHPGIAYATYEQRLSDTSITVEAEFADDDAEALFLGLRIQSRPLSAAMSSILLAMAMLVWSRSILETTQFSPPVILDSALTVTPS